jgi:hypothetical protein
MAFRKNRRPTSRGSNPGLTPIDDISEGTRTNLDPDPTTGRLPSQDELDEKNKRRRAAANKDGSSS